MASFAMIAMAASLPALIFAMMVMAGAARVVCWNLRYDSDEGGAQCLNFLPLPQGQGSLRPIRTTPCTLYRFTRSR
jgi:hypothetical protein